MNFVTNMYESIFTHRWGYCGSVKCSFQFCFGVKFLLLYLVRCDRLAARQMSPAEMQCCMPIRRSYIVSYGGGRL
jgi:hypothetical protein